MIAFDAFQTDGLDLHFRRGIDHQQGHGVGFNTYCPQFFQVGLHGQHAPELDRIGAEYGAVIRLIRGGERIFSNQDETSGGRAHVAEPDQFESGAQIQGHAGFENFTRVDVKDDIHGKNGLAPQGDERIRLAVTIVIRRETTGVQFHRATDSHLERGGQADYGEFFEFGRTLIACIVLPPVGQEIHLYQTVYETARESIFEQAIFNLFGVSVYGYGT